MNLLSKTAILTANDLQTEDVEVPEWGGAVRVRSFTGRERDAFEASMVRGDGRASIASTLTTSIATKLTKASNLSDLTDIAAARSNLALGSMALQNSNAVAISGGTLVYDPVKNKVHVLSSQKTTARRLANLFSQIGFQKPLSKQPVDAVSYDLSRFKQRLDLKSFPLSNAIIEDAWVASLMVSLGHSAHSVTVDMKKGANVWDTCADHFGETNPISSCLSVQEIKVCYSVRFDGETAPRALDIALAQGGTCNLLAITDPRLRRCGDEILTSLGVMKRVQDIKAGANIALFRAEMKLLDLAIDDIDGHLVSALGLVAEDLVDHGLVKKKMPGHSITVPVESADGETGYQVLQVQSNSKRSWATDKLSGHEYDLHEGDLCRYGINKAFLRERIDLLLRGHLADRPVRANEQEPFVLGNYGIDDQHIPVVFVSRLWDAHHADRMDTALRQAVPGFSIILTSTAGAHHNYLGSGMVFSIDSIILEEKTDDFNRRYYQLQLEGDGIKNLRE